MNIFSHFKKFPFCHGLFASHRLVTLIVYQISFALTSLFAHFLCFFANSFNSWKISSFSSSE
ncbi:hypothetical protein CO687_09380 [Streptococcus gordonii]|nr:hypothetical protein CO687_09380 [Streptococcus gordonii]